MFVIELQLIWTQTTIPKSLRECYKNNVTLNPPIPLNLRILIDIIQKMEKYSYSTIDMRIMSSSILHRYIQYIYIYIIIDISNILTET